MKKFIVFTTLYFLLNLSNMALAAPSFDLTTDYEAGDTEAVFELVLSVDSEVTVNNYALAFSYDIEELQFESYTNTPAGGLWANFPKSMTDDAVNGELNDFTAFGLSPQSLAVGDYLVGTFTFSVLSENADGVTDFDFDLTDILFAITVNGTTNKNDAAAALVSTNFTDIGGSATVPVPAAIWLLGSGVASLACLRRRKND